MPAFASLAEAYDQQFSHSHIGRLQRKQVHRYLEGFLPTKSSWKILEFNCGTGEDACWLAAKGHTVIATDIEAEMVKQVQSKSKQQGLDHAIITQVIDMKSSHQIRQLGEFDLIFSNFGGINCLSPQQLSACLRTCVHQLRPNGHLIVVYMSRSCVWEQLYYILKGNFRQAFRRKKKGSQLVSLGKTTIPSWYYAPREIKQLVPDTYQLRAIRPIGLAVPPAYLEAFFSKQLKLLQFLYQVEKRLENVSLFSDLADHSLIHFQKTDN